MDRDSGYNNCRKGQTYMCFVLLNLRAVHSYAASKRAFPRHQQGACPSRIPVNGYRILKISPTDWLAMACAGKVQSSLSGARLQKSLCISVASCLLLAIQHAALKAWDASVSPAGQGNCAPLYMRSISGSVCLTFHRACRAGI